MDGVVLLERIDDHAEASGRVNAVRDDDEEEIEVAVASRQGVLPRHPMIGAGRRGKLLEQEPFDIHEPG